MSREAIIRLLRLVLPYPMHWYESKSLHELEGIYASRRGEVIARQVELSFEKDDRLLKEQMRRKVREVEEDKSLPWA